MLDLFKAQKSDGLRGFMVWLPMVAGDDALDAEELTTRDKRFLIQGWDGQRVLGEAFAKTLKLRCPAWDVYLVYDAGVKWTAEDPPMPSFWMHQLSPESGADPKLHLKAQKLRAEVAQRLAQLQSQKMLSHR